jgi:hypothetical protein
MSPVTKENVQAFLSRNWSLARATKDRAIYHHVKSKGPLAAFALSQTLLDSVCPKLQTMSRRDDLLALIELKKKLTRVSQKMTSRKYRKVILLNTEVF